MLSLALPVGVVVSLLQNSDEVRLEEMGIPGTQQILENLPTMLVLSNVMQGLEYFLQIQIH